MSLAAWPEFDDAKTADDEVECPIQINGKVRAVVTVPVNASKEEIMAKAELFDGVL